MRPVPHLAARAVPDRAALSRMLTDLAAVGVDELLLVGGLASDAGRGAPQTRPRRSWTRDRLEEAGIVCVGVRRATRRVSPDIGDQELGGGAGRPRTASRARARPRRPHFVTQFCFRSPSRDRGVGTPDPGRRATCCRCTSGCPGSRRRGACSGSASRVGGGRLVESAPVRRREAFSNSRARLSTDPRRPIGLAAAVAADPGSLLCAADFFPFGVAGVPTAEWACGRPRRALGSSYLTAQALNRLTKRKALILLPSPVHHNAHAVPVRPGDRAAARSCAR